MAPVRSRLVAAWMGLGLSEVAKMGGKEDGSSMGPSSGGGASALVEVVGSSAA